VVSSGYNNIPEGDKYPDADGKAYLFVLDLNDGTVIKKIATGEGSINSPSGLAAINVMVENVKVENKAIGAYGGDLLGNMWRFNLEEGTASKVAALGPNKPIMVTPVIADVGGKTVLYFGTGLYLGEDHLDDVGTQSIYAIRDDGVTTVDDASMLVEQKLTGSGSTRGVSSNPVNWSSVDKHGWYMDLGDEGERVTLEPTLYFGTLIVASTVPTASECQPGGYSWLYQLDYRTGGVVGSSAVAGWRHTSPLVGVNLIPLGGKTVGYWIKGNAQNPPPEKVLQGDAPATDGLTRVLWREMFE
jgi:type IV pilus assembly protein PilY1